MLLGTQIIFMVFLNLKKQNKKSFWLAMLYLLQSFTGYYITIQLQYYIRITITPEMPARVHGKPCIVPSMSLSSSLRSPHSPCVWVGLQLGGSESGSQADGKLGMGLIYIYVYIYM